MSGIIGKNASRSSGVIGSASLGADAVSGANIADDAIDSEHYTDGSIDNAHIADDAIDSEHYADGSIDNAHIADDAIDSEHYADGSIDNAHIADDAIDSEHYADGSIDTAHIATNQIDETLMKDAFVGDFTDATVTASDYFLHGDATDSGNTKKDTIQGILDLTSSGGFTQGTEIATTSGTTHTFTGIPAGTSMIIVNFIGVSLNGAGNLVVAIGDSGGIESSGYTDGSASLFNNDTIEVQGTGGSGFAINFADAADAAHGQMILTLEDASGFTWASSHTVYGAATKIVAGAGTKSLSAELTQVQVLGGTFDAGAVNIMYQ
jgi:hypothetical protein